MLEVNDCIERQRRYVTEPRVGVVHVPAVLHCSSVLLDLHHLNHESTSCGSLWRRSSTKLRTGGSQPGAWIGRHRVLFRTIDRNSRGHLWTQGAVSNQTFRRNDER